MEGILNTVRQEMEEARARRPPHLEYPVCLVAVSKTHPVQAIIAAYSLGCRHFGENYVNELYEKSNYEEVIKNCPEIKWHFIGHVQSKKVNKLVLACPNLHVIETLDSIKLADMINKFRLKLKMEDPLNVMIQVNTSREESKSGVLPEDVDSLAGYIISHCPALKLIGLMTIGLPNHDLRSGPNPDYVTLFETGGALSSKYRLEFQLSMGMSDDFQHAIELGSNSVRIGSRIFGPRQYTALN